MNISPIPADLLLAMRWSLFREDRFLGKVVDEWIADSQEFIHTKLPKLAVIAIIALVLSRLLRLISSMCPRSDPSRTVSLMRISDLPRRRATLSQKVRRFDRTACRIASSVSKIVPKRKGSTVAVRKLWLTTRACSSTDFSSSLELARSYSLTITANSPLG